MNTIHDPCRTLVEGTSSAAPRRASLPLGMMRLTLCTLVVISVGCDIKPKPVSGTAVSPIQLKASPRQKEPPQADTPAAEPARTPVVETRPVRGITPVGRSEPPRQVLQMSEVGLPQQPKPQPEPTQGVQPPIQQEAPAPAIQPQELVQEPQSSPAISDADIPLLKKPGMADQLVSVNFDGVDIRTVLKTIGEITGINFIPHQSVTGTVTVMSPTPIRLGDIYAFLQSILDVYGYAAVETDNAVKIIAKADAARNYVQVRIGADPEYIPRNDAIATQILPLKYADATEVSQLLQPILASGAQMGIYPRTNSIMITDTSANIHHVAQVIGRLDVAGSREKAVLLPLRHASARVVSEQIIGIMERTKGGSSQAGRPRPAQTSDQAPNILPDDRTNSLIVVAGEQDIEMITQLVSQIDIERPTGTNNVHVVYLKNGDANEVARSLEAALVSAKLTAGTTPNDTLPPQVAADKSTNSLIIVAPPQEFEVISEIVDKLDTVREQVFVEMQIIEVTEEALQEIGVDWATLDDAVAGSVRGFGLTNLGPALSNPINGGTGEGLFVGAWKGPGTDKIGFILQALKKESGVNILSTPQILTSNHRKASIIVGENRPFVTQSRITESVDPITPTVIQGFEYRDVGITLDVTPHVSQGGLVRLEVHSEFTKLIEDVSASSLNTPVTAKRSAKTVVTMHSGATVVIGGLIRDDKTRVTKKIPLLGDLPVLGALFQDQRDRTQKTNLLIFITPHIMTTPEQLQEITQTKRDQMTAPSKETR
ncbi:MAG: type II secretion system secretin GspD [Sedimentisphaerales bacterium]|nr:type II secretion system secretin GspD [Sedimentisphaerales bacterium]